MVTGNKLSKQHFYKGSAVPYISVHRILENRPQTYATRQVNYRNPESWALESGIQLKESGIPLTIGIQNLSSADKESGIR